MTSPPRILLIKPKEIGDSLILTPTIRAVKRAYPQCEIWVVVRRGCEGILAGCPEIDRLLALTRVEREARTPLDIWRDLQVLWHLRSVHFDAAFELSDGHRGRLFTILSKSDSRYTIKPGGPLRAWERKRLTAESSFDGLASHRVERDYRTVSEFLRLPDAIPGMVFERDRTEAWPEGADMNDFVLMQIGTRKEDNRWSREKWGEVAKALLEISGQVVISSGPLAGELADARWLQDEFGPRIIPTWGKIRWAQVAGLLYRARLYVGLNTAAMHLATACSCPIVALFGRTSDEHWYPWQAKYRIVADADNSCVADAVLRQKLNRDRRMATIEPAQVIAACREMIRPPAV